jgi:hypothetical protein
METPALLCAALALLVVIAVPFENIARLLRRSRSWDEENGHDRAERRELDWYGQTDLQKSRDLASRRR